jgi:CO/xanthine dehydrogenase Mo-binding subunit
LATLRVEREQELRYVGRTVMRRDGDGKVTGDTKFFSDMALPNMLWGIVLRSRYPHALIKRIDTSRAGKHPGVVAVLTHRDVPGRNGFGIVVPDQPVLCKDKVRYLGDAIAVVAAETKEAAEEAVSLIKVDYEPLPLVTDPVAALNPNAPKVHEKGNLFRRGHVVRGDVEAAFREPAVVVENTYQTGRQMHMYLELESGIAYVDKDERLVVYAGGQSPYRDQMQISRALGIPPEKIRVISTPVGGAFGGKEEITVQIHLALLAMRTKRPVKMVWSREESGIAGLKRHPMRIEMKTAADKRGQLIANKVRIYSDTGAYASLGSTVLDVAIECSCGPYRIPNVDIEGFCVYTNNGVAGAFRGFGAPQVNFAIETQVDLIAEKLGIDRLTIRKTNVLRDGQEGPFGKVRGSVGVYDTIVKAEKSELWVNRESYKLGHSKPWSRRGVGVSVAQKGFGFGALPDFAAASIELTPTGKFLVGVSCPEIGQGNTTAYAQIAAEALRCMIDDVYVASADSSLTPDSGTSSASMSMVRGGNAILAAAPKMLALLIENASELLGLPREELYCEGNAVRSRVRKDKIATYERIAAYMHRNRKASRVEAGYTVPRVDRPVEGSIEIPHWSYMYATALALVEVDPLTGATKVLRFELYPECGRIINPQSFVGQCEGAVAQGLGYALVEDTVFENGRPKNFNFTTYIVPTMVEVPEIVVDPVETYEPIGPYGAKGAGEIGIVPVASAISNAIYDAVGTRLFQIPAIPERVFGALKEKYGSVQTIVKSYRQ